jgi:hypothetical protein
VCGIQNLATSLEGFLMQITTPAHYAFVRKFWLESVLNQSATPGGVITFDAENARVLSQSGERVLNKSNSHLPLEQN